MRISSVAGYPVGLHVSANCPGRCASGAAAVAMDGGTSMATSPRTAASAPSTFVPVHHRKTCNRRAEVRHMCLAQTPSVHGAKVRTADRSLHLVNVGHGVEHTPIRHRCRVPRREKGTRMTATRSTALQLRSVVSALRRVSGREPRAVARSCSSADAEDDGFFVSIEATPLNPSDLGLMFGPADLDTLEMSGTPSPGGQSVNPSSGDAGGGGPYRRVNRRGERGRRCGRGSGIIADSTSATRQDGRDSRRRDVRARPVCARFTGA